MYVGSRHHICIKQDIQQWLKMNNICYNINIQIGIDDRLGERLLKRDFQQTFNEHFHDESAREAQNPYESALQKIRGIKEFMEKSVEGIFEDETVQVKHPRIVHGSYIHDIKSKKYIY